MKTQQWYESQRLKTQTKEEVEAELRETFRPTATDPTYKPRRWTGEPTKTPHWMHFSNAGWTLYYSPGELTDDMAELNSGDIFIRPDAPKPTEPPPDVLEGCSTVDWIPVERLAEGNDITDRLDALEKRMTEMEKA